MSSPCTKCSDFRELLLWLKAIRTTRIKSGPITKQKQWFRRLKALPVKVSLKLITKQNITGFYCNWKFTLPSHFKAVNFNICTYFHQHIIRFTPN